MVKIFPYKPNLRYSGTSRGFPNGGSSRSPGARVAQRSRSRASSGRFSLRDLGDFAIPAAAAALGGPLAGAAASAGMSLLPRSMKGPWEQGLNKKGRRYAAGRWTGYIKRKKLRNKRKIRKTLNNSYQVSVEKSFTQTPTVSGIVGHATGSRQYYKRAVFGAMLRKLFVKAGISCTVPNAALFPMKVDTSITCTFIYGASTTDGFNVTIGAVPITFTQVLDAFVNAFNSKFDTLINVAGTRFVTGNIRFRILSIEGTAVNGGVNTVSLDISEAKISLWCTSRLKIQNRSINTPGDDDADDVDNVPINCVAYSGYGTGTDSKYDWMGTSLNCTQDCILNIADPTNLGDAPIPQTFKGVKKSGFFRVQPGNIQTNVIKFKKVFTLDTLMRILGIPRGDAQMHIPFGKFTFIHLEKTLEANNAAPVAMSIACENQLYIDAKMFMNSSDIPVPEFTRS